MLTNKFACASQVIPDYEIARKALESKKAAAAAALKEAEESEDAWWQEYMVKKAEYDARKKAEAEAEAERERKKWRF